MYPGAVLPMVRLKLDTAFWKPGALDAVIGCPHHCDGNPTLYISTFPGVWLSPLGYEAVGKAFQNGLHLCS